MKQLLTFSIVVFLTIQSSWGQVALTPPMGWNTWNYFGKNDINEQIVRECIDAIIENHLKDYGYSYVIVDGGWRTSKLDTNGKLIPDSTKFPNGIKSLVDYAHSKGLKFGLHTVPGTHDCGGDKVGGYGLEEIHIQQFIDWGLDFIKVDRCRLELPGCEECWTEDTIEKVYRKWRSILDNKGSNMILSISAYKFRPWNPDVSNLSRTTSDLSARVSQGAFFSSEERGKQPRYALSVLDVADINNESAQFAKPGYWNDPDILVTGDNGLSFIEQRSHFALWCIMSAPLILGNDVRKISDKEKEIILNKEAISINQDPTEQGIKILNKNDIDIWRKRLKNGSTAILLINRNTNESRAIDLTFEEIGINEMKTMWDVHDVKELGGRRNISLELLPHDSKFLLFNR